MKKNKLFLLFWLSCQISLAANFPVPADTKFPIVLIQGLFGFSQNMSCIARYWGDIPELLMEHGAKVYVAKVSQAHATEKRGEQLYRQLVKWGHRKYNLVGHSLGGLDARYVLENYPNIVASVTTISSPHRGSKVADYLDRVMDSHAYLGGFTMAMGNVLGHVIGLVSGEVHAQNALRALHSVTTPALKQFNQTYPIGPLYGSLPYLVNIIQIMG